MKNLIIYNRLPLYPDEVLISYLNRLAKANSMTLLELLDHFLYSREKKHCHITSFDIRYNLNVLRNIDIEYLFIHSTLYPLYQYYRTKWQLRNICDHALHTNNYSMLLGQPNGSFNKLRLCPACALEELEKYGEYYYHRSHQVKSVHVCHKHGTALKEINSKKSSCTTTISQTAISDGLDFLNVPGVMLNLRTPKELEYAIFIYKLLNRYESISQNDISTFINNLHSRYTTAELLSFMRTNHTYELMSTRYDRWGVSRRRGNENILAILFEFGYLPAANGDIKIYKNDKLKSEDDVLQEVIHEFADEFEASIQSETNKVVLTHKKCGYSFSPKTVNEFLQYPKCPMCDKNRTKVII